LLEYEKAVELEKEILIYIADDEAAAFPSALMDDDAKTRRRLAAFKAKLRERHTVDTFSTPQDLAEKLSRDFKKHFLPKESAKDQDKPDEDVFEKTARVLKEFRLTPKRYNGFEVRLRISFYWDIFPASRALCEQFNLDYGFTVGSNVRIVRPTEKEAVSGFSEIYATGNKIDAFRTLRESKEADLYAQLQFTGVDVKGTHAEFLGRTYYDDYEPEDDPRQVYVPPEGRVILLFTKPA
jgi:hypothetical protein